MADMVVKLYELDKFDNGKEVLARDGVEIIWAMSPNLTKIRSWIFDRFGAGWDDEATGAILARPSTCFLAVKEGDIVGFVCYDATARGYIGPLGVAEEMRGHGIGRALLWHACNEMYHNGYPYGIIGGVGEKNAARYTRWVGALLIEDSDPGFYRNLL